MPLKPRNWLYGSQSLFLKLICIYGGVKILEPLAVTSYIVTFISNLGCSTSFFEVCELFNIEKPEFVSKFGEGRH